MRSGLQVMGGHDGPPKPPDARSAPAEPWRSSIAVFFRGCLAALGLTLGAVLVGVGPLKATAEILRWIDEQGSAHYSEGIDSVPERYKSKAVPLGLRNAPAPTPTARDRAPREPVSAEGSTRIRYQPGERILVDVRLNGRTSARLLLDTGADRTLITPRTLFAAGAELKRPVARGEMRGVTGGEEVVYVLLESIEIGEARVERLPVAAYEMASRETDGLLGRDFLDRFNVSIDASRGVVTLTPR